MAYQAVMDNQALTVKTLQTYQDRWEFKELWDLRDLKEILVRKVKTVHENKLIQIGVSMDQGEYCGMNADL